MFGPYAPIKSNAWSPAVQFGSQRARNSANRALIADLLNGCRWLELSLQRPMGTNTGPTRLQRLASAATLRRPVQHSRRISALFAEFRAPLCEPETGTAGFHAFDLIGAVRANIKRCGRRRVPKLGFRWQP